MIEILIPTFNRVAYLINNLRRLDELIKTENLQGNFRILISDNCSEDNTTKQLKKIKKDIDVPIFIYEQKKNIGGEKNCVFLLHQSKSNFIMFTGDDDYLPSGYLSYLIKKINSDKNIALVIPGNSELLPNGDTKHTRIEKFREKKYFPGFNTVRKISYLGHQLSGILFRRESVAEEYLKHPNLRNLYLFIFFVSFNALRGNSYYAPKFKIMVSTTNKKDWTYDDSGLLTEVFKNYKILYPDSVFKRFFLAGSILIQQGSWRLRLAKNPSLAIRAMFHIWKDKYTDNLIKIFLPFFVSYLYLKKTVYVVKNIFLKLI